MTAGGVARVTYIFPPPPQPAAAVQGSEAVFPVRRIYCVGRNYAAHIREMGFEPEREPPFFFMKPGDAVTPDGAAIAFPPVTADLQYEGELVIAIGRAGADVPQERALELVYGYAAGIDLTRRDRQIEARDRGRPWEMGKSFDASAPLGPIHPAIEVGHPAEGPIRLWVNGQVKQDSDLSLMIWKPAEVISILSRAMRLEPGDLIYTGTPAGVGRVQPGDEIRLQVAELSALTVRIGAAA